MKFLRHLYAVLTKILSLLSAFAAAVFTCCIIIPITLSIAHFVFDVVDLNGIRFLTVCAVISASLLLPVHFFIQTPLLIDKIVDLHSGYRSPSQREYVVIQNAYENYRKRSLQNGVNPVGLRITVDDDGDVNAFAYGKNSVALSRGLLKYAQSKPDGHEQLMAVIAHEAGHHRHGDCLHSIAMLLLVLPAYLATGFNNLLCKIPLIGLFVNLFTVAALTPYIFAIFIKNYSSTTQEYLADEFAAKSLGPEGVKALLDYFSNHDERPKGGILSTLTRSHPPSELRRDNIEKRFPVAT
ncbi:M48 family metalloprotease [Polycladidibacter hongkongensis]|uniref:M48 family metalloprotease n=1 Tax=Polycladidibacter hongkongensis TaxID=1647556 RepID=UPI0008326016|nr:M48 family metalloprotease [Pseudovibrio hongkongensis]